MRGSHLSVALGIRRREKGVENDDRLVQIPDENTVDFVLAVFFPLLGFLAATPSMKYWDPPRKSLFTCLYHRLYILSLPLLLGVVLATGTLLDFRKLPSMQVEYCSRNSYCDSLDSVLGQRNIELHIQVDR